MHFAEAIAHIRTLPPEERSAWANRINPPSPEPGIIDVAGRCPSCGFNTLFVGSGGHLTCSWVDCKDPCAADTALAAPPSPEPGEFALALSPLMDAFALVRGDGSQLEALLQRAIDVFHGVAVPPSPPQEGEGLAKTCSCGTCAECMGQIDGLRAALEFYADPGNYTPAGIAFREIEAATMHQPAAHEIDGGDTAREALAAAPASPVAGDVPVDSVIPSAALKLSAAKSQIDAASPVAEPEGHRPTCRCEWCSGGDRQPDETGHAPPVAEPRQADPVPPSEFVEVRRWDGTVAGLRALADWAGLGPDGDDQISWLGEDGHDPMLGTDTLQPGATLAKVGGWVLPVLPAAEPREGETDATTSAYLVERQHKRNADRRNA